ncbi:MAG: heme A synthase [Caldilinea sp. CFX5]|nr:heme A synthase [Caldilinea sp. CFX5]
MSVRTARMADLQQVATTPAVAPQRAVTVWLFTVCALIIGLTVFGGYVRLTRSGLSIVEWNVLTGVIPPIGEAAWQAEFAKYQATPEFEHVNFNMTLADYQRIFYVEYIHRLIARLAGLIVVVPLGVFLWRGLIPWRRSGVYLSIAALFGFQGFLGWYMVSSGLVDRPAVSHFRLTIHLLVALTLLGLTLWTALNRRRQAVRPQATWTGAAWLAVGLLLLLLVQIAYGGLVAGLKAGHAADTWPYMFGYLVPPGLLTVMEPWWANLLESVPTVHFIHRWFAFVVLIGAGFLYWQSKQPAYRTLILALVALVLVQIALGVSVIWFHVPLVLALLHQATALLLFVVVVWLIHQLLYPIDAAQ